MQCRPKPNFFLALFCIGGGLCADLSAQQSQAEQLAELDQRAAEIKERNRLIFIVNTGIEENNQGNYTAALARFQEAMNQGFRAPEIHFHLGVAHAGLGQARPALTELDRYLQLEPNGRFVNQASELIQRIANQVP